jgi:Na+-translocating ferredoxin:NAD+ oxidoreductase subunit G
MNESVRMVLVLTLIASFSGGVLAGVRELTMDRIEYQQLKFQKEPVIKEILADAENDPMADRFKITDGDKQITVFPGIIGDKHIAVFESTGKGFGGDIGLLVSVDLSDDTVTGVGVTTHSETPGFGSRAKEEPFLKNQFKDKSLAAGFSVKKDGGQIDSISGATITSRGVCSAVNNAEDMYKRIKPELESHFDKASSGVSGGE